MNGGAAGWDWIGLDWIGRWDTHLSNFPLLRILCGRILAVGLVALWPWAHCGLSASSSETLVLMPLLLPDGLRWQWIVLLEAVSMWFLVGLLLSITAADGLGAGCQPCLVATLEISFRPEEKRWMRQANTEAVFGMGMDLRE